MFVYFYLDKQLLKSLAWLVCNDYNLSLLYLIVVEPAYKNYIMCPKYLDIS